MEPQASGPPASSSKSHAWLRLGNYRLRLAVESVVLFFVILCAVVWYSVPYLARDYINRGLSGLPDYSGRVEWVRIHPLTVSMDIYDVHLDKKTGKVPVSFFYCPRTTISLQGSELFRDVERASVIVDSPRINLVAGPNAEQSQMYISKVWIDAIKELIPWRVNQVQIHGGDVHFLDFHATPKIDLEVSRLELDAENMSNSRRLKVPLPATVTITASPLVTGTFVMHLAVNFDEQFATFTQNFTMDHVPASGANSALQKYYKVRVKSGEIALYSELTSDKGVYHGYVKPFFSGLEFEPNPGDEGNPGAAWSGLLNVAKGLFEDDDHVIATQSEISGRVDRPNIDAIGAITGALRNAYLDALRTGFDPSHSPSKPTDTVTTPLTDSSAKAAAAPSPAAKN